MDRRLLEWVFSGGLLLAWMPRQSLKVTFDSTHLIHINLLDNKGKPISITFVYAQPDQAKREEVWQQLSSLKATAHPNWLCIGDFNQTLSKDEKFSFTQGSIVGANLFQQVILDLHLCDLTATGQKFTWMNNREENGLVMERLDRAFASAEWINMYPSYSLRNIPIIRSNHGPVILDFDYQTPFRKRPFRFEHMWTTHPSCKDMVQQAWVFNSHGSRAKQLRKKLLIVIRKALEWKKNVFGKVERDIKLKQAKL